MIRTISISLCTLLLFSCGKEKDVPSEPKPATIKASIQGRVLDENGKPAYNITIKSLNASATTAIDGEFRLENAELDEKEAYVYTVAPGYFSTGKTIAPRAGSMGFVEMQLIKKNKTTAVPSATPGTVSLGGKSALELPANGVIRKAQKTAYAGEISVFASYVPPGALKSSSLRPGGNYGYDKSGKKKGLRPYGMLAIELEGTGGEQLQLADGKTATIKIAIPASIAAAAPATIPLWYFDEEKGVWKEEGTATKNGDVYTGTVSHFSFWSADMPEEMINLSLQMKNKESKPFAFHRMRISEEMNDSSYNYLYTDSSGSFNIAVPRNKDLRVAFYDACGGEVKVFYLPPMDADKNLGLMTIDAFNTTIAIVKGTVTNCNGAPVTNGYALVNVKGNEFTGLTDNQGRYSIKVTICSGKEEQMVVVGGDQATKKESLTTYVRNIVPGGEYTVPAIQACGISNEAYFDGTLDGEPFNFIGTGYYSYGMTHQPSIPYPDTLSSVHAYNNTAVLADLRYGNITFKGPTKPGVQILSSAEVYNGANWDIRASFPAGTTLNITEYGAIGQFIAGTMIVDMYNHAKQMKVTKVNTRFRIRRR